MTTLFVSDLDHTLLRSDATLSAFSHDVLEALIGRGVLFTYATARSHGSARRATGGLDVRLPVITYGGTMTVHAASGQPSAVRYLTRRALIDILRLTDAAGLQALVHTYAAGRDAISWIDAGSPPEGHASEGGASAGDAVSDGVAYFLRGRPGDDRLAPVRTWDQIDLDAGYYVSIIGGQAETTALREALTAVLTGCLLVLSDDAYAPGMFWLEIHSDAGSKAKAAQLLAAEVGATRLVVFGDNHNDVPLFEVADEAYAVANAVPELRALATAIIGTNDEDAVATWLAAAHAVEKPPSSRP
jgi:hydroxymethylpyrimidine pyrophosphatase-like HAD family hydrolase